MLLYLFLYFKIIPPRKVDQNSKKNIKKYVHECKDLIGTTNYQYGPEITNNYFTVPAFAYCDSSDVTFYNNKFKNFKVKNDPITSNAYLFHTNNVNMNVTSNSFTEITMHHTLIYCNGDAQLFTMVSNIINDCHSFENTNATIVEVFVQNTDIQYNSIFFNPDSTKGRAFRIKYHTGCKLIGNHITNALYSSGCAVYFEQCSDNSPPLEISDCVFTSCLGDNSAIFYLANLNSKLTLTNITFEKSKNKPVGYNENHKPCVVFDGCKFSYLESNANGGGAIGLWLKGSNDNIVSNLTFYNTQFEHLQFQSANNGNRVAHGGGALCFDNQVTNKQVELFVIGCTFTNVSSFASGGAINFNTPGHTLYVEDCNFSNTFTVNSGQKGGAIYAKVVTNVMPIIIKGCQFQNTQSNTGGALYIERSATSNSDINFYDCTFDHVSSSAEGHAIHIASSTLNPITISFCHIVDCGTARNTASVYLDASKFEFSDNEVTFSDVANSCGCLKARRSSSHVYRNNVFSNSRQDYNDKSRWTSAGIHDDSPNSNANYFEIENNTFDNILGNNQGRCFLIEKVIDIKIKGNSIQNCPEGAFYIKVLFDTKKEEFSIEDCKFINNTIGNHWFTSFGMNPQIWIQNKGPATGGYYQLTLNFVNCYFENNFNQKKGGALWYGKMEYNADTKVVINHCQFVNNRATEDGGALALYPYYGCEIIDCEFIRNRSDQGKGAIYIETDFSSPKKAEIMIEGCKFEDNEGTDYSCISFNNVANTPISITNNNFTNCGSNGYVILIPSNMKTLNIESNNITYDKNTNSGGISISSTGNINIIDTNFKSTRTNSALMINSIQSTETTTNEININGCSFDQCDKNNNNNGDSLYITDSNSDKVIISYCYFIDCGTDSSKYSIYFDISNFEFIYNEITFSDPTRSCRCIKNNKVTEHLYRGNIFRNSRNNGDYNSACIDESTSNSNANVLVEDNIFDYIVGPSQGRCIFINCNQNAEINVRNNTIKNLPSGGFYIKIAAIKCTFETCKFINNSVSDRWLGTLGLTPQIWIETSMASDISNEVTLIFNGCYFENNYSPKQGGGISYGKSKHVCNTNLEFHECKFIENRSGESGSALSLISYQGCNIDNCEFIRNRSGSGSGCIYIETEFNCKENNKRPSSLHPVINIHQCLFDSNVGIESSSMTIGTTKNTQIHIDGCLFTNEESGSVILIPLYNQQIGTSLTETLKLDNNTFDSITGNEQGNCINVKYGLSEGLVIRNNTIQNCPSGGFYFKIEFTIKINEFKIDTCQFINNTVSESWSSTDSEIDPQIWIQNNKAGTSNFYNQLTLSFDNCYFENNYNPVNGGALYYGKNKYLSNTKIIMNECIFVSNQAKGEGGAISLFIYQGSEINKCEFTRNRSEGGKGAIYIETDFPCSTDCPSFTSRKAEIMIEGCKFEDNEGTDYSCISFNNVANTPISITNNNFTNCGSNGYVILIPSNMKTLNIESNNITYDKNTNSGGISISSTGNINIIDTNFKSTRTNSALMINSIQSTETTTNEININGCSFDRCGISSNNDDSTSPTEKTALSIESSSNSLGIIIDYCIFDSCSSINNNCFDFSISPTSFAFKNSVLKGMKGTGCNNYLGSLTFNNQFSLVLQNISFIENSFKSLYGGGIGLMFKGLSQLQFDNCNFVNNEAIQDTTTSRPNEESKPPYYNGDGGAIQLGYICSMRDMKVIFSKCDFERNKAQRHGGAISIQTLNTVELIECTFNENKANYDFGSELLFMNYYEKKLEGRGGAIYLNPIFTYSGDSECQSPTSFMSSVNIDKCTFTSNTAYDGFAFYVEGDASTTFTVNGNNFINNYDLEMLKRNSSIIATEVCFSTYEDIVAKNSFENKDENGAKVTVLEFTCVDHNGNQIPTKVFTNSLEFSFSEFFSHSEKFSESDHFSNSNKFTESSGFSKSGYFSNSESFSNSKQFSESNKFSGSNVFSKTRGFSYSKDFSKSSEFSVSSDFSKSNQFSNSKQFTESNKFSNSRVFSETKPFSFTSLFSYSSSFSVSSDFSKSIQFSISKQFTQSNKFSGSNVFSKTRGFSYSKDFSKSSEFSVSNDFTKSNQFSNSKQFTESDKFSNSRVFSETKSFSFTSLFSYSSLFSVSSDFSKSNQFSISKQFSESNKFSGSNVFSKTRGFSYSKDFSYSSSFSVSSGFSKSNQFSNSKQFSQSNKFSGSNVFSKTRGFSYSKDFSKSSEFSVSNDFTKSNQFSNSKQFTESDKFSNSRVFSETKPFSFTSLFSYSSLFSVSSDFSKSNQFSISKQFTKSDKFTATRIFSETKDFTKTEAFSISTIFTSSDDFTKSSIFSPSLMFSTSAKFSQSSQFSYTGQFTETNDFSRTADFSLSHKFSVSNDFSQSVHFTGTTKFSYSKDFTNTEFFTRTDAFTKTSLFSASSEFSLSGSFTQSRTFSLSLKFSHSKQFTETNRFSDTSGFSSSVGFSESGFFTPSASLIPSNPSCGIFSDDGSSNFTQSGRCDYSDFEGKNITVQILSSNFTDYYNDDEGAAIRVVNCKFKGNGTYFYNCVSTKSGGAIYISNSNTDNVNNISLQYCQFIRCEADFGGAVFIHSGNAENEILILCCLFLENRCDAEKSSNISSYGGSAVFLSAAAVDVVNCTFEKSKGKGGAFKIVNPTKKKNLLEEENEENKQISFSGCEFNNEGIENGEFSNAIYYIGSNKGSVVDVNDCNFKGKLNSNNHYIDGKITENNSPKFNINSCKFQYEFNISVKTDLVIKASSIEVVNGIPNNEKTVSSNFPKFIFCISFLMASFLLMFIRMNKLKLQKQNEIDNFFIDNVEINI